MSVESRERREHVKSKRAFMLAGDEDGDSEVMRLEALLAIDAADVESALCEQPDLYYRAALIAARLEAQVAAASYEVAAASERVAGPLRERNLTLHEPLTDTQIAARVCSSSDVDRAERRVGDLRRRLGAARALEAAYVQRLRVLAALGAPAR